MVNLILQVRDWLVHRHQPPPLTCTVNAHKRRTRRHTHGLQSMRRTHTGAHMETYTSAYTTWCGQYVRAKHNLAFEPVTIIGSLKKSAAGKIYLDDKQLGNSLSLP